MRPWQGRWLFKLWYRKSCSAVRSTIHEAVTHFPTHPMLLFTKTAFLRNSCFHLMILSLFFFFSSEIFFSVRQNQNKSFKTLQFSRQRIRECVFLGEKNNKKKTTADFVGKTISTNWCLKGKNAYFLNADVCCKCKPLKYQFLLWPKRDVPIICKKEVPCSLSSLFVMVICTSDLPTGTEASRTSQLPALKMSIKQFREI